MAARCTECGGRVDHFGKEEVEVVAELDGGTTFTSDDLPSLYEFLDAPARA